MNDSKHKKPLPLVVKIAVKKNVINKDQLKRALTILDEETGEGKDTSLPEILVKTGMVSSQTMIKLHTVAKAYSERQPPESKPEEARPVEKKPLPEPEAVDISQEEAADQTFSIRISEDNLTAHLEFPFGRPLPFTAKEVLGQAEAMGIIHGLIREISLEKSLSNAAEPLPIIIARGTPPDPGKKPSVDYRFDPQQYRLNKAVPPDFETMANLSSTNVRDGDLLAEKTPLVPSDSGVDIFGNSIAVPPVEDILIRSGKGAEVFDDQLKVFSTVSGVPFLSVEGVFHVFPQLVLKKNFGIVSGPMDRDSCLKTSGTVTGEYPVRGGWVIADEIRDANIDVLGSVVVRVGITGSVIKAQGDIRARSIRGCTIETHGSVYVENEIMDSTIYASGVCICENSKIITSTIAANGGIKATGIGTDTSVPCKLSVGNLAHIRRILDKIDNRIQTNEDWIKKLDESSESLSQEQKKIRGQLAPLVSFHKKAEQALQVAESRIEELKQKKLRERLITELNTFNELKAKDQSALQVIRNCSDRLKEIQSESIGIPEEIRKREMENRELILDRSAIFSWSKTLTPSVRIDISGKLCSGTNIFGPHAEIIVKNTLDGVVVQEGPNPSDPEERQIVFKKLTTT